MPSSILIGEFTAMKANIQNKSKTRDVTRGFTACLTSTRPWIQHSVAKYRFKRSEINNVMIAFEVYKTQE